MFDAKWDAGQAIYIAIVLVAVATIAYLLFRAFRRKRQMPWPAFYVGLYNILLLLLYLFGMITEVGSEGFGFFPLFALATPWSWLILWLSTQIEVHDHNFLGTGLVGTFLTIFIACNIVAASVNSSILYLMLKHRQRKQAEDEEWEQARRNR
ncbi:MAG: hypothetical protein WA802_03560 [Terracidiphilus sp.]